MQALGHDDDDSLRIINNQIIVTGLRLEHFVLSDGRIRLRSGLKLPQQ
jgi:hypothetical protein